MIDNQLILACGDRIGLCREWRENDTLGQSTKAVLFNLSEPLSRKGHFVIGQILSSLSFLQSEKKTNRPDSLFGFFKSLESFLEDLKELSNFFKDRLGRGGGGGRTRILGFSSFYLSTAQ